MTTKAARHNPRPTHRLTHSISLATSNRPMPGISRNATRSPSINTSTRAAETSHQIASPKSNPHSPDSRDVRPPSPSYFGLMVDSSPDSRPTDICPRDLWCPTTSIRSFAPASPHLPPQIDVHSDYEAFRKQVTQSNPFNLGHGSLSIFSSKIAPPRPKLEKRPTKFEEDDMPSPKLRPLAWDRPTDLMQVDLKLDGSHPLGSVVKIEIPSGTATKEAEGKEENESEDISPLAPLGDEVRNSHASSVKPNACSSRPTLPLDCSLPHSATNGTDSNQKKLQIISFQVKTKQIFPPRPPPSLSTVPKLTDDKSIIVPPSRIQEIVQQNPESSYLLLDLRVSPQFSHSRIQGALNLCIPTTLLKRPSFNLQKLNDTFTNESERLKFSQWPNVKYIIVYDAISKDKRDAISAVNTLRKFALEGWNGSSYILQGGFQEISNLYPSLIDNRSCQEIQSSKINLSLCSATPAVAPVAGGCLMPLTKNAVNPFFGNIRQNQDLIGGVGQIDIKLPLEITTESMKLLPKWLRGIAEKDDHGKIVSHKYLRIEQEELATMTKALSGVCYDSSIANSKVIRLAGIENGGKNRYNNIWPYEHSRVKLLSQPAGACDYVNASHIKASWGIKRYIASQGPLPATFNDFWSVIWDQNVSVIVMLTAESEDGQLKCHNYWSDQTYGRIALEALSETQMPLEPRVKKEWGRRRATTASTLIKNNCQPVQPVSETPHVIVRKFALSHVDYPYLPSREITQIHYFSWPDFGAPASPSQLLALVELTNVIQRSAASANQNIHTNESNDDESPPILVHCSAGCGRTGTFCTIDSVIDILKRQRKQMASSCSSKSYNSLFATDDTINVTTDRTSDLPIEGDFDWDGDTDLVEKTVADFRSQRLSMVQNLKQFVLCYETVLEWVAEQVTNGVKRPIPMLKKGPSVSLGISGGRDRYGSVF